MRVLVALALLAVVSPAAFAERVKYGRDDEPCFVDSEIYPRNGATGIPRNAHAWVVNGTPGNYSLRHDGREVAVRATTHAPFRIIEIPLGMLEPNAQYTLVYAGRELTTFTTSRSADTSLPDPPYFIGAYARMVNSSSAVVGLLATSSYEAAMMKLTIHSEHGQQTVIAPEQTIRSFGARCMGVELEAGERACFDVSELDGAGNRSAAVRECATVGPPAVPGYDVVRGASDEYELDEAWAVSVFLTVITLFVVVIVLLVRSSNALSVHRRNELLPISAELAKKVALAQRYDAKAMAVACTFSCVLAGGLRDPDIWNLAGTLSLAVAIISLFKLSRVTSFLRFLNDGQAPRYAGDRYIFVGELWVVLKPAELRQLVNEALPAAKIR